MKLSKRWLKVIKFLNNDLEDIKDVIVLTSNKLNIPEVIIEKDLWVSFILDFLFTKSNYKNYFQFKGGTSLSKGFNLINRFSEDIDIVLNGEAIDVNLDDLYKLSKNKRSHEINIINEKALLFYETKLIVEMDNYFKKSINKQIDIKLKKEELAIYVSYPSSFNDFYIKNEVKIEIGPISAWKPNKELMLDSYISKEYPNLFEDGTYLTLVTEPIRTFYEKLIILHKEAHREGNYPIRYSRHYYDVYKVFINYFNKKLIVDEKLLEEVRVFHEIFYYRKWANFETATIGSFKLIPNNDYLEKLEEDYELMKNMIYGNDKTIAFKEIIDVVRKIEQELNQQ